MKTNRLYGSGYGFCAVLFLLAAPGALAQTGKTSSIPSGTQKASPATTDTTYHPLNALSPDGNHLATTNKYGRIEIRQISDGAVERTFNACAPRALAFSCDSNFLASVGVGSSCGRCQEVTIRMWAVNERRWVPNITMPGRKPEAIAVSATRVVISTQNGLHCFRVSGGKKKWRMLKHADVEELKFSSDGAWITARFADGSIGIYDAETGRRRNSRKMTASRKNS